MFMPPPMTSQEAIDYLVKQAQSESSWGNMAFTYVTGIASIAGFAVTLWVLAIASDVRTFFFRKTRVPQLRDEIRNRRAAIGACMKAASIDEQEVREHFSIYYSNLKSLKGKVPRKLYKEVKKTSELLNKNQAATTLSNPEITNAYSQLLIIETDISNWLGDLVGVGIS